MACLLKHYHFLHDLLHLDIGIFTLVVEAFLVDTLYCTELLCKYMNSQVYFTKGTFA
jgi:hypothetical protein